MYAFVDLPCATVGRTVLNKEGTNWDTKPLTALLKKKTNNQLTGIRSLSARLSIRRELRTVTSCLLDSPDRTGKGVKNPFSSYGN
jgi:hypothetical protein